VPASTPRSARSWAVPLVLFAAVVVSGCTSAAAPTAEPAAANESAATAADLAALGKTAATTDLPDATVTVDDVAGALIATQPQAPPAVGPVDSAAVKEALAFAARLVAATRGDGDYLCGPASASRVGPLSTPGLQAFLVDPANDFSKSAIESTISGLSETGGCGPLRWVGPGVLVGPSEWEVLPGTDDAELNVRWTGKLGYVLAAGDAAEPWMLDAFNEYGLVRTPVGWRLDGWPGGTDGRISTGWPAEIPVPDGYLTAPEAPQGDPAALDALVAAADAWRAAAGVTANSEVTTPDATVDNENIGAATQVSVYVAAPARGDAAGTWTINDDAPRKQILLDGGRSAYYEPGEVYPRPGHSLPAQTRWQLSDDKTPGHGSVHYPDSPFEQVAFLSAADAAAESDCPPDSGAARCYTALAVTADQEPDASGFTTSRHLSGLPFAVATVGLDDRGRLAYFSSAAALQAFGEPKEITGTTRFTGYSDASPPAVDVPDPATVARSEDLA
jgi:hypothetical protein